MITHRLNITCPFCEEHLDAQTVISSKDARPPGEGDIGLCISCGEFHFFTADGGTRKPTDDEQIEIGTNQNCRKVREIWRLEVVKPRVEASMTVNGVRWEALTKDYPDLGCL